MVHQENKFFSSMNKELNWKFQEGKMDHWSFSFQKLIQMLKFKKKIMKNWQGKLLKNAGLLRYGCSQLNNLQFGNLK